MQIKSLLRSQRSGFTLIELLVAVALTITIMGIIGWALGRTLDTFRLLNGTANLQTKMVAVQAVMKRDLSAEHFGGNFRPGYSGPYVGDQRLDLSGWTPPEQGFFNITQVSDSTNEGNDGDGIPSTRAINHTLHFSVKLSGRREEDYFYASLPGTVGPLDFQRTNMIASRWAEVYYFLVPNSATADGTTLYTLYRRQRVAQDADLTVTGSAFANLNTQYPNVSHNGSNVINTSAQLAVRANRLQPTITTPGYRPPRVHTAEIGGLNAALMGDDILMTDVLSFEVKGFWFTTSVANGGASVAAENTPSPAVADWPFAVFPASPRNATFNASRRTFDTWSQTDASAAGLPAIDWDDATSFNTSATNRPPIRVRLVTLQIRLRVWDANTKQTRQVTFLQDI